MPEEIISEAVGVVAEVAGEILLNTADIAPSPSRKKGRKGIVIFAAVVVCGAIAVWIVWG